MGVPDDVLRSALRFSFAAMQSCEELVEAAHRIATCIKTLRT